MRWNSSWIKQCFALIAWSILALPSVAAQEYAYIANNGDGTVSVVKTASYEVAASIPVAASPVALAVSPNGKQLYVASAQPEGKLSVVDLDAQVVIATLEIGLNPSAVAVSRDGAKVYISNTGSNSVSVVDTASLSVIAEITVGESPRGLAVSPDGARVYVANCLSQTVSTISVEEGVESGQVMVGRCPVSVRLDAGGQRAYVANSEDNSISTLDLAENQVTATLDAGSSPEEMTLSPDGSRLYVANTTGADFVSVFDTRNSTLLARISVPQPGSLATSPEGGRLFVTSAETQSVTVVNAVTNQTVGGFAVGAGPRGATVTPPSAVVSGVIGQIVLGPGCVLYREGDTNCNPKPYQASIVLKNENRTAVVTQFSSDGAGQFVLSISPGKYWVEMPNSLVRFPYLKPFQITVPDSQYVPVTVYYDTGIR